MTRPTMKVYHLLKDHQHASSIPIDVAKGAVHHQGGNGPLESLVYLKTVDGNELDKSSQIVGYQVRDTGAVLLPKNERGAWACPIGRLEDVVNEIVENTGYIITEKRGRFDD